MNGYSWLETLFADRWRWVRKLSRARWIKLNKPGYSWIKLDGHFASLCRVAGVDPERYTQDLNFHRSRTGDEKAYRPNPLLVLATSLDRRSR
jgi:hypothetical protein